MGNYFPNFTIMKRGGVRSRLHYVHNKGKGLFVGFLACMFSIHARAEEDTVTVKANTSDRFSWNDHRKLSWSDFKGAVSAQSDESAAATCCSIAFKVNSDTTGEPKVSVYNTFYINRSWVKEDARIGSILNHEQGHFDLCELYTRKLRERAEAVDMHSPGLKQELLNVYATVSSEYETRQQAYEQETAHGTNIAEQHRWEEMIAQELNEGTTGPT